MVSQAHRRDRAGSTSAVGLTARRAAICVCTEGRNWFETDFPNWLKEEPPRNISAERRSDGHGSYIIEGLGRGVYRGHFNVINHGQITKLPGDCAIELPGYVDKNGINMPVVRICRWRARPPVRRVSRARDGNGGGGGRRCHAAQAGHAARSADRSRLQPGRDLAVDRRMLVAQANGCPNIRTRLRRRRRGWTRRSATARA